MKEKEEEKKKIDPTNTIGNKGKGGKPKFSFYWIYAVLLVVIIGMQLMNWNTAVKNIDGSKFEQLVRKGEVEKVIVIKNEEIAEIYLTQEALKKEDHKDVRPGDGLSTSKGPQYLYEFGSMDSFDARLKDLQEETGKEIPHTYETRHNVWGDALSWLFPVLLLVGAWFFIMRMMSRGGAGGGGQIFNIGKSKAQLFDKDTHVNINFSDVAGLEEA
ncbi:MAG: ATP-dependent metallopeptidase FtsH/Yme1/Tma family protein, partial [Lentimicrobiaceae bacterium]|nr:ATP-dependent metallopeptidase FtsH/Yme1/Tma family protein [Lentimicrobiaceae bacterium]